MVRDVELEHTLQKLEGQVGLVITDSQAFKEVSQIVPENIPLTSFSILFARSFCYPSGHLHCTNIITLSMVGTSL